MTKVCAAERKLERKKNIDKIIEAGYTTEVLMQLASTCSLFKGKAHQESPIGIDHRKQTENLLNYEFEIDWNVLKLPSWPQKWRTIPDMTQCH